MKKILVLLLAVSTISSLLLAGGGKGKSGIVATSNVIAVPADPTIPIEAAVLGLPLLIDNDDDFCRPYVGVGMIYNRVYSTNSEWFNIHIETQDETGGFVGLVGCEVNEYLAVEARWSKTFWDQDYSDTQTYGIYLKPKYPVTKDITVYALMGIGKTHVEGSSGDPDNDYSAWPEDIGKDMMNETTFHWGFGATYDITERIALFGEFTSTANDLDITATKLYDYGDGTDATFYDKLSVDGLTLGLIYNF